MNSAYAERAIIAKRMEFHKRSDTEILDYTPMEDKVRKNIYSIL